MTTQMVLASSIDWQKWGTIFTALGLAGSILLALIKLISVVVRMQTTLHLIATNHLPHLYDEIKTLREDFIKFLRED